MTLRNAKFWRKRCAKLSLAIATGEVGSQAVLTLESQLRIARAVYERAVEREADERNRRSGA